MNTNLISGSAGQLEIVIEEPNAPAKKMLGIVCHPHPLHEGTMNNKVVTTVSRTFTRLGVTSIRFNFRGVGQSEGKHAFGVGESDDLRAVIEWGRKQFPDFHLLLAGFSFGSYIAAKVATEEKPTALIMIAPPVHHNDFAGLPPFEFPSLVVQGDADEIVPPQEVYAWLSTLSPKPIVVQMPGVGHFFHGKLIELREDLTTFLQPILHSY